MKSNIILCGFMGSGKSTVGKLLAQKLGFSFVDTDDYIEAAEGKNINTIFAENGEKYFRSRENDAAASLSSVTHTVIATGGGFMLDERNAELLKKNGFCIYLKISAEEVFSRLSNDTTRPLLSVPDRKSEVTALLKRRDPRYRLVADAAVNAELTPENTAEEIERLYRERILTER